MKLGPLPDLEAFFQSVFLKTGFLEERGRLYRNFLYEWGFVKPLGYYNSFNCVNCDFIDIHSTMTRGYGYPALWLNRDDMSLREMMKAK